MITIRAVTSTSDFDFDRLYGDSYSYMTAGTFTWPTDMTDEAERKQYFANWINRSLSDPMNFHGIVISIDGIEMIYFTFWFTNGVAYIQCSLIAYDQNGSKAYWTADNLFISTWQEYVLGLNGIENIGIFIPKHSPLRNVVMNVYSIPESAMEPYGEDCERGIMPL